MLLSWPKVSLYQLFDIYEYMYMENQFFPFSKLNGYIFLNLGMLTDWQADFN